MTKRATAEEVHRATQNTESEMHVQPVPVNVYESPEALMIVAPLPAVQPADVTIELTGRSLRFWAHLRSSGTREYLIQEWLYGGYERVVDVPEGFGRSIEASLANGQLAIRVLRGDAVDQSGIHPTHGAPSSSDADG